jgi:methyl-accepting chemotaxis protein
MVDSTSAAMEMPPPPVSHSNFDKALPRRRFFSDMPDKGLFGMVALLGFVMILVLKVRGHNADYIAGFAVLLMLGYGALAFNMPLVQMRLDRLGDNFYYLGFIFTLASLAAALVQLRMSMPIEELLGSFGIALVTTIVGIAGRVMFVQLRNEIDDVEEHVRRDLAAASADLRAQLSASVREFETFRTGLLQTLKETTEEFADARMEQEQRTDARARTATQKLAGASGELQKELASILREFEAFRTKFAKASAKHVAKIEELTNTSAEKVSEVFDTNRRNSEHVSEMVTSIRQAVDTAGKRLAEMELPSERLNEEFDSFVRKLEELTGRLAASSEGPRRAWTVFRR